MTQPQTSKHFASLLWYSAEEFYHTYAVLMEDKSDRHDFLAMKHYLLCHALELTLKGWLADTGNYNEKILKERFGHDLEKLAIEVKQVYGLSPELAACSDFISIVNNDYKSKGYEYPINDGQFRKTDHEKFSPILKAFIDALVGSIVSNTYPEVPLP